MLVRCTRHGRLKELGLPRSLLAGALSPMPAKKGKKGGELDEELHGQPDNTSKRKRLGETVKMSRFNARTRPKGILDAGRRRPPGVKQRSGDLGD